MWECCQRASQKGHRRCGTCKRWLVGRTHTAEARTKISASLKAVGFQPSSEARERGLAASLTASARVNRARSAQKATPMYSAAHNRVRAIRGAAASHRCVDCRGPASEWSYDHQDPQALYDDRVNCYYSLDTARYQPRCVQCHRKFDQGGAR